MIGRFYSFTKRVKSTMRPADDLFHVDYTIHFKQPTDYLNPTIILDTGGIYPTANYMALYQESEASEGVSEDEPTLTLIGYYFISNIVSRNANIFELRLELDYLATTKDDILAAEAFVIYSSSNFNRWMKDERIPTVVHGSEIIAGSSAIISTADQEPIFSADALNETVILSAVSADMGLMHYVIDENVLKDIAASLAGTDIHQFLNDLQQQFGDAAGSIVQIRRMPVNKNVLNYTQLGTIYLGAFEVTDISSGNPIPATYLNSTMVAADGELAVPLTYTDFRYTEPYCTARMSFPFVGIVDIAISDFPAGTIYWKMLLDVVSGTVVYSLYNNDSDAKPVISLSGECGMLIPIASAQIANTGAIVTSAAPSIVSLAAGAMTGNPIALVGGIIGVTQSFTALLNKSVSVIGSYSGNRSEFFNTKIRIMVEKYATALEPSDLTDIEGRPCCQVLNLATLTGYCRTQGFQLSGNYLKSVKDRVNALLDSGIYIE